MIENRIEKIKSELQKTVRTRRLQRSARDKVPYPIVALIGYTNAGKSTLFNYLTKADVVAKDLLFATLDPTMRLLKLNSGQEVILSDTVGFIADLPTTLIAAFRATLEEVCEADIILHVRDISHEDTEHQKQDVDNVLKELGLEHAFDDGVVIEVWNKYDLLSDELKTFYDNKASSHSSCLPISAITGVGIEALKNLIDQKLANNKKMIEIILPSSAGALLAWCYRQGMIRSRFDHDDGIHLTLSIAHDKLSLFWKKYRDEVEFEKKK
jgi:GTP-binding protein HflX